MAAAVLAPLLFAAGLAAAGLAALAGFLVAAGFAALAGRFVPAELARPEPAPRPGAVLAAAFLVGGTDLPPFWIS